MLVFRIFYWVVGSRSWGFLSLKGHPKTEWVSYFVMFDSGRFLNADDHSSLEVPQGERISCLRRHRDV